MSSNKLFLLSLILFIVFNVLILVLCKYPADYMYDTLWQLDEIQTGNYTNHHSIYHTWLLELFCELGKTIGIGLGGGLFLFLLFQIIIVGLIASFFIMTMYEMKVPLVLLLLSFAFILINPISLKYITYVDKDELFVYAGLLFCISLTRIILDIGNTRIINWVLMIVGSLGFGLLRGNGMVVLFVTMISVIVYKTPARKRLVMVFLVLAIVIFMLSFPIRSILNVKPSEFSEILNIPIQQVSRVVYDDNELTEEEENAINHLVSTDIIKEEYSPTISDPVKGKIQFYGKDDYLREHKMDYLKLWVELGIKYPKEYIEAWVDQTYGYWTLGYGESALYFGPYQGVPGIWDDIISEIEESRKEIAPTLTELINIYAGLYDKDRPLYQFIEMGFIIYLLIYLMIIKFWKKKNTIFIEVLGIMTIGTLVVASPLSEQVRYAYIVFLVVYLSIATTFYKQEEDIKYKQ